MSVTLIPYTLGKAEVIERSGYKSNHIPTTKYEQFDSGSYSGDKDFILTSDIEWTEVVENENDINTNVYSRPNNLCQAREWVMEHIFTGNQKRLLDLIDAMEKDERLYLYISW